ncbi:MAG: hypothetical protein JWR37_3341 [Mycobacterium sp.]|nr:hypothetical protein [Mycobacterium sp.]
MVRTRMNYNISLFAAAVAAMAIATAPSASAAPSQQPRFDTGGSTTCQAPGNVQIFSSPHALPAVFPHSKNPKWRGVGYNPKWPALGHNPEVAGFWL